jgi:hypothetical protein
MIVAHLPAGYVAAKLLHGRIGAPHVPFKRFLAAGLLGAVAPDFDILYFYLVDQRQHHHHTLWPHFPIVWAGLLLASLLWFRARQNRALAALAVIFSLNGLVHMVLDTVAGNIWWLMPFVNKPFVLVTVPARYDPWWLSFIFHWTFVFELAIIAWAVYLWRRKPALAVIGQQGT